MLSAAFVAYARDQRHDPGAGVIYVDPELPDWLPSLTISNLRAGRGSMTLRLEDGKVDVSANTSGYEVVAAAAPRSLPTLGENRPRSGGGRRGK